MSPEERGAPWYLGLHHMDTKSRLPPELYRQIVRDESIGRKEILKLCLTSRDFSVEAYPLLYRRMDFGDARTSELAFRTLCALGKTLNMIYELIIRSNLDEDGWFKDDGQEFTNLVRKMNNLCELDIAGVRNGSKIPRSWWAKNLVPPHIKTLRLSQTWGISLCINDLFSHLPTPLPRLIVSSELEEDGLHRIEHLECKRILPTTENQVIQLPYLKSLVLTRYIVWDTIQWLGPRAPNLHTLIHVGLLPRSDWSVWVKYLEVLRTVKKAGPIVTQIFDKELADALSPFELESVLYTMPLRSHEKFDRATIKYMMQNSPTLQRVSVAFFEYTGNRHRKICHNVEIWEKKVMTTSETSCQPLDEPHHWLLSMDGMDYRKAVRILLEIPD